MNSHLGIKDPAAAASAVVAACTLTLAACGGGGGGGGGMSMTPPPPAPGFADTALVSDATGVVLTNTTIDSNLQNPWGVAFAPGNPFWISDEASNVTTLYTGTGQIVTGSASGLGTNAGITIPVNSLGGAANPTGQVFNGTGGFAVGGQSMAFILDGQGGTISGWAGGAAAVTAFDDTIAHPGSPAVYKGLAIGAVSGANFLYATDFHNNKVDVFDTNFAEPALMQGKFVDAGTPALPAGFAPFGITAVNNQLYVTYAMQDAAAHDEVLGAGLGYVDIFDMSGNFVNRFASAGALNAPWGVAVAPTGFGSMAGDVLIGNFGDGHINAYTTAGATVGALAVNNGGTVALPGLWTLVFGNGDTDKPMTTLFYTAGFANQTDGVFGTITPQAASSSSSGGNPY
jgi:uncharacterized protein (TIGR03118 family)